MGVTRTAQTLLVLRKSGFEVFVIDGAHFPGSINLIPMGASCVWVFVCVDCRMRAAFVGICDDCRRVADLVSMALTLNTMGHLQVSAHGNSHSASTNIFN